MWPFSLLRSLAKSKRKSASVDQQGDLKSTTSEPLAVATEQPIKPPALVVTRCPDPEAGENNGGVGVQGDMHLRGGDDGCGECCMKIRGQRHTPFSEF